MQVRRVKVRNGTHVDPPLDPSWPDATKLDWLAAVVSVDTGLRISVTPSDYRIGKRRQTGYYCVMVAGHSSTAPYTYRDAWVYLSGISTGSRATKGEA
jgi:hypothetical protein